MQQDISNLLTAEMAAVVCDFRREMFHYWNRKHPAPSAFIGKRRYYLADQLPAWAETVRASHRLRRARA